MHYNGIGRKHRCAKGDGIQYHDGPVLGSQSMPVNPELKECVGFLTVLAKVKGRRRRIGIGTCFFVFVKDRHGNTTNFIVTAKHVWKDMRDAGLPVSLRLNRAHVNPGDTGVVYFEIPTDPARWCFHKDQGIDLALLLWSTPETNVLLRSIDIEFVVRKMPEMLMKGHVWPPQDGHDVLYMATMHQYHGREKNYPIIRQGRVALVTDEPICGKFGLSDYLVIDAQVYKGNSGAPVWALFPFQLHMVRDLPAANALDVPIDVTMFTQHRPSMPTKYPGQPVYMGLVGVLAAAWPETQEVFERVTEKGKPTIHKYNNLGIALVTPAKKILEVIEQAEVKAMIEKDRIDIEAEPIPLSSIPKGKKKSGTKITKQQFEEALKRVSRKLPAGLEPSPSESGQEKP